MNPSFLEVKVEALEAELGLLREVIEILVSNCACTAAERYSGHLVDCPIPKARDLLQGEAPDETNSERARDRL